MARKKKIVDAIESIELEADAGAAEAVVADSDTGEGEYQGEVWSADSDTGEGEVTAEGNIEGEQLFGEAAIDASYAAQAPLAAMREISSR